MSDTRKPRILLLCHDVPYPPIHGGRWDMWMRIVGFARLRIPIQLLYWYDGTPPSAEHRAIMESRVDNIIELKRIMRIRDHLSFRYPPRMKSCEARGRDYVQLLERVRSFSPGFVWLDVWYGYLTGKRLAQDLNIPLIYRSQNVEFQYFRKLASAARGALKAKLLLNLARMFGAEREMRDESDVVFDISEADLEEWREIRPGQNSHLLLPTWLPDPDRLVEHETPTDVDILFVGNLSNPTNIAGLEWFCSQVLPAVKTKFPQELRILFAGSNPTPGILNLCRTQNIECIPNVKDVFDLYRRTKVIINPQLEGSGLSLKMIEVLVTDCPVVTTVAGLRGIPAELHFLYSPARSAEEFARHITDSLLQGTKGDRYARRSTLNSYFGILSLMKAISLMMEAASKRTNSVSVPFSE